MHHNYLTKKSAGLATITVIDPETGECEIAIKQFSPEDGSALPDKTSNVTLESLGSAKAILQAKIDEDTENIASIDVAIADITALLQT